MSDSANMFADLPPVNSAADSQPNMFADLAPVQGGIQQSAPQPQAPQIDWNSLLAPARQAVQEQHNLQDMDNAISGIADLAGVQLPVANPMQLGFKTAAAAHAGLDLAQIAPNLIGAMPKLPEPLPGGISFLDPRLEAAKRIAPIGAEMQRNALMAGKKALENTLPAQVAPEAFKQYSGLVETLAPMPNVSAAALAEKVGLPAWQAAINAGKYLPMLADSVLSGAGLTGAISASDQIQEDGKIDPAALAISTGLGGALGGALGTIGHVLPKISSKLPKAKLPTAQPEHTSVVDRTQWLKDQGLIDLEDEEQAALHAILQDVPAETKPPTKVATESPQTPLQPEPPADKISDKVLQGRVEENAPTPAEQLDPQGAFRYNLKDKPGYQRSDDYQELRDLDLERIDRTMFKRLAEAGAKQKYLEQLFEAKVQAFTRKHGDPSWAFDESGLKGGIKFEVNLSRQDKQDISELRFSLADDVFDKRKKGIRGLSETAYGQGKSFLPAEVPAPPDDRIAAAAELINARMDYLEAEKAFKKLKKKFEDRVFELQADRDALDHLRVITDVPHPAGSQYGTARYGIETYHPTLGMKLDPKDKPAVDALVSKLEQDITQGLSPSDWRDLLQLADRELSVTGQAPLHTLEARAKELAKEMGIADLQRTPYKAEVKMSDYRRVSPELSKLLNSKAARGSTLAAAFGILADLPSAEASDGKTKKHEVTTPITTALVALGIIGFGAHHGHKAIKARSFVHLGNVWRDTLDMVQMMDREAGTAFFNEAWRHMAGSIRASWGVQFDNPEHLMQAVQELKEGTHLKAGSVFSTMNPSQKAALVQSAMMKKNLAKKLTAHIKEIEERMTDPNHAQPITKTAEAEGALEALKAMQSALTPPVLPSSAITHGYHAALANIMDYFFFWNPEHHLTNLTDQWIAGGSRVGLHNIAKANYLLAVDPSLKQAFQNSNLIGGVRVDRAEQKAILTTGKQQGWLQKRLNSDLPSDQLNADRVGLAAILEYADINGIKGSAGFAKDFFDNKLTPEQTMDVWVHMTERISRTLGVDPFRVNKDALSRTVQSAATVFFKQPARMARLLVRYVADGNWKGVLTVVGMTALIGGRAAIPSDLGKVWETVHSESYFAAAELLDRASPYNLITHSSMAGKLSYGLSYPFTGSSNIVGDMLAGVSHNSGMLYGALRDLEKEPDKAADALARLVSSLAPLTVPKPFTNKGFQFERNVHTLLDDEKTISVYDAAIPVGKKTVVPSEIGINPLDLLLDPIIPGKPLPFDQIEQQIRRDKKH